MHLTNSKSEPSTEFEAQKNTLWKQTNLYKQKILLGAAKVERNQLETEVKDTERTKCAAATGNLGQLKEASEEKYAQPSWMARKLHPFEERNVELVSGTACGRNISASQNLKR